MSKQYVILPLCVAQEIGLNEAIILNQLYYKLKTSRAGWVCCPYYEWKKLFCFWSNRTIQRIFLSLEKSGAIESKKTKTSKIYRISESYVKKFFSDNQAPKCPVEHANLAQGNIRNNLIERNNKENKKTLSLLPKNQFKDLVASDQMRELIKIWNNKITQNNPEVILTSRREKKLSSVFVRYFDCDRQKWENFVNIIEQSNFLMGRVKDFRANIDWAIQEPYITRILEGTYNNKIENEHNASQEYKQKVSEKVKEMFSSAPDSIWFDILSEVLAYDGEEGVYSWFRNVKYERLDETTFSIKVESPFCRDYINVRYMGRIRETIARTTGIERPVIKMIA